MAGNIDTTIQKLSERLGDDQEALLLIATLSAAYMEQMTRAAYAEMKLAAIGNEASKSLQASGQSLTTLKNTAVANSQLLAELYQGVYDRISKGGQLANQANDTMKDVLDMYEEFNGNANDLRDGVKGLAKSTIESILPEPAKSFLNNKIDQFLGE